MSLEKKTGTLISIDSITPLLHTHNNKVMGPGYFEQHFLSGNRTEFTIKTKEGKRATYFYDGIILPDSIGNTLKLSLNKTNDADIWRLEIYDEDLKRDYKMPESNLV